MARTPRFCKILLEDFLREGKLGFPKKFARRYRINLSDKVFLKVPSGAKWRVELVKNGDGIWFGNGWNNFVDYYSLSHGTFLVFEVEDFTTCSFNVVIFDWSTSEIRYPFHVNGDDDEPDIEEQVHQNDPEDVQQTLVSEVNCNTQSEEIIKVDVSPPRKLEEKSIPPFSGHGKKMGQGSGLPQGNGATRDGVVKKTQKFTREARDNVLDKANSDCKSNDLCFSIVMHETHLTGDCRMAIPRSFADKYLKKWEGHIVLKSVDEKIWSVKYASVYLKKRKVVRVGCGWRDFVVDNHLEVGDVCDFEAIDHNATQLKVVICRGNQDAMKSPPIGNKQHISDLNKSLASAKLS